MGFHFRKDDNPVDCSGTALRCIERDLETVRRQVQELIGLGLLERGEVSDCLWTLEDALGEVRHSAMRREAEESLPMRHDLTARNGPI